MKGGWGFTETNTLQRHVQIEGGRIVKRRRVYTCVRRAMEGQGSKRKKDRECVIISK